MKLRIDATTSKAVTATTVELNLDPNVIRTMYLALAILTHLCIT